MSHSLSKSALPLEARTYRTSSTPLHTGHQQVASLQDRELCSQAPFLLRMGLPGRSDPTSEDGQVKGHMPPHPAFPTCDTAFLLHPPPYPNAHFVMHRTWPLADPQYMLIPFLCLGQTHLS